MLIEELKKAMGEDSTVVLAGCNGIVSGCGLISTADYDQVIMLISTIIINYEQKLGKNKHMIMEDVSKFLSTRKEIDLN